MDTTTFSNPADAWKRPDAPWRQRPTTDRQRLILKSYGIECPPCTSGESADLIGVIFDKEKKKSAQKEQEKKLAEERKEREFFEWKMKDTKARADAAAKQVS